MLRSVFVCFFASSDIVMPPIARNAATKYDRKIIMVIVFIFYPIVLGLYLVHPYKHCYYSSLILLILIGIYALFSIYIMYDLETKCKQKIISKLIPGLVPWFRDLKNQWVSEFQAYLLKNIQIRQFCTFWI